MKRNPGLPRAPRTFVIRVLVDGEFRGQISEPTAEDDWQATFASADALWALMRARLAAALHEQDRNSSLRVPQTRTTAKGESHDS